MLTRNMADVSSYNVKVNMTKYRQARHRRIAIKATQGSGYVNPHLGQWASEAHNLGLAVSYYHYCEPSGPGGKLQVAHFWRCVSDLWLPGDALHFDLETDIAQFSPGGLAQYHNEICRQLLSLTGHDSITYMNLDYYSQMWQFLHTSYNQYWIAAYGDTAPDLESQHKLWAWQFTDGAIGPEPHTANGIGRCDISRVNTRTVLADAARAPRTRWRFAHKRG
jgi:lysozyme